MLALLTEPNEETERRALRCLASIIPKCVDRALDAKSAAGVGDQKLLVSATMRLFDDVKYHKICAHALTRYAFFFPWFVRPLSLGLPTFSFWIAG